MALEFKKNELGDMMIVYYAQLISACFKLGIKVLPFGDWLYHNILKPNREEEWHI